MKLQTTHWQEIHPGDQVGMMQGYAINLLAKQFHPQKIEMGFLTTDTLGYRLTLANNKQAIYIDRGNCLELLDSVSLTKIICEEHLQEA